jgi:hypothetical protein
VKHVVKGSAKLPSGVNDAVYEFVSWPDLLKRVEKELTQVPKTFVKTPEDFKGINTLEDDVKILTSYHNEDDGRTIALINLRNGHVYKEWIVDTVWNVHDRICHPLMLPDSSIIYGLEWNSGLNRLSKESEVLWRQKAFFNHHGKNMDTDSTLWTCSYIKAAGTGMPHRGTFVVGGKKYSILDNNITRINAYTGEILFDKSVLEIMFEHGLEHLLIKSDLAKDPIHLNDVQPALKDGPYFDKGDLFLSARNGSWIMQYRPSTDSVIRLIEGPFYAQHDVDIESDSTLLLFNNNTHRREIFTPGVGELSTVKLLEIPPFQSEIVRYYLGSDRFERVENRIMSNNNIYTMTEGVVDVLPGGGYFVEEQNSSLLWVIKDGKVRFKGVLPSHHEGYHHLANWARVMN